MPETVGEASPESLKDTLGLLDNTKRWSLKSISKNSTNVDIKYSALRQDDSERRMNGNVGQEIFDNVNFDYDDFSDEDDDVNLLNKV